MYIIIILISILLNVTKFIRALRVHFPLPTFQATQGPITPVGSLSLVADVFREFFCGLFGDGDITLHVRCKRWND